MPTPPLPARVNDLLDDALDAMEAGQARKALRAMDEAVEAAPFHPEVIALRAQVLVEVDRVAEAQRWLTELRDTQKDLDVQLTVASTFLDLFPDDHEVVLDTLKRAEGLVGFAKAKSDLDAAGEASWLLGRTHAILSNLKECAESLEAARTLLGDDEDDLLLDLAIAWFELCRFDDAKKLLEGIAARDPDAADAWHFLGLIAERAGDEKGAERLFSKARALDPDSYQEPVVLSDKEFDAAAELALSKLPDNIAEYLENVPVIVEPLPKVEDLTGDPPLSPLSLGLFKGNDIHTASHLDPWNAPPTSILLFKKNLERYATSRADLVEEIETTLLHEIGHFFGWDEDEVRERGLG